MTNPYRDLWAELENAYQRALAALAKLEPEGPTDEEIEEWADACSEAPLEEMDPEVHGWRRCFTAKEFSETIRAALARFGRPTPQPPADGEVGELVETLKSIAYWRRHGKPGGLAPAPFDIRQADRLDRAADLLERLASDNVGLAAAAESAYLDNLSLLDSQND